MPPRNTPERLRQLIAEKTVETVDGCLLWLGKVDEWGYAKTTVAGKHMRWHRIAYELANGPIPVGLDVDHVCHTISDVCPGGVMCLHRRCLNPGHMEPVTRAENNRRSGWRTSECKNGHPFDVHNTYLEPNNGRRSCRRCNVDAVRRYKDRQMLRAANAHEEPVTR